MKKQQCNVCLLQPYLTPYRVGIFNALSNELHGHLTLLYFSKEEERRKWDFNRDVQFQEASLNAKVKRASYERNSTKLSILSLAAALIKLKPAVVICDESRQGRMVRCLQFFLRFKIIVWTETNEVVLGAVRPKKWLVRFMDRGVSAFLIPGELTRKYLVNVRKFSGRFFYAPNTIDRGRFSTDEALTAKKFEDTELRFLYSGSLVERKGIETMLSAFEKLAELSGKTPYRLDIIGDGPLEKRPVNHVNYHGFVDQDTCASMMKNAHVFVLPSFWDCNPLTTTEAVTSGCVTVLSDGVGNYPEYADGNGFVFERSNAASLHDVLRNILDMDAEELKDMALRSLEIASQVSHENSAKIFMQAISDTVN